MGTIGEGFQKENILRILGPSKLDIISPQELIPHYPSTVPWRLCSMEQFE